MTKKKILKKILTRDLGVGDVVNVAKTQKFSADLPKKKKL